MKNVGFLKKSLLVFWALTMFTACEKDTEPVSFEPEMSVLPAEGEYRFGATVSGSVNKNGSAIVKEYGIQYSIYDDFAVSDNVPAPATSTAEKFTLQLTGLEAGKTYFYRAYAFSGHSYAYSRHLAFSTPKTSGPAFSVPEVKDLTYTSVKVQSEVLDDGGVDFVTTAYIYKQVADETDDDLVLSSEGVQLAPCDATYAVQINNLESGKMYAIRAYGISAGLGYGDIVYVTTLKTENTLVSTVAFSNEQIGEHSVEVSASILAEGTHPITAYGFCYSATDSLPDINDMTVTATNSGATFSSKLRDLQSQTSYNVRAYVKNNQGEIFYSESSEKFTTSKFDVVNVELMDVDQPDASDLRQVVFYGNYDSNVELREVGFLINNKAKVVADTDVPAGKGDYAFAMELDYNTAYEVTAYALTANSEFVYGSQSMWISPVNNPLPQWKFAAKNSTAMTDTAVFEGSLVQLNTRFTDAIAVTVGICVGPKGSTPTMQSNLFHVSTAVSLYASNTPADWTLVVSGLTANTEYSWRAYYVDQDGYATYTDVADFKTRKPAPGSGDIVFPGYDDIVIDMPEHITLTMGDISALAGSSVTAKNGIRSINFRVSTNNQSLLILLANLANQFADIDLIAGVELMNNTAVQQYCAASGNTIVLPNMGDTSYDIPFDAIIGQLSNYKGRHVVYLTVTDKNGAAKQAQMVIVVE